MITSNSPATGTIALSTRAKTFLQVNQDSLQQLVTFIDFAPETFNLGLVSVNFPEDRAAIIEALKHHPTCQDILFAPVHLDDPNLKFLRDELIKKLSEIEREPDKKLVVLLTGLENSIGMVGDYPPVLVDLNYVRDGFASSVPYPIVLFLPDKSLTRLAKFAPDVWAWQRILVTFQSSPETVTTSLRKILPSQSSQYLEKPVTDRIQPSNFIDHRTKRDTIPRLLMEYETGILSKKEEYKKFKEDLITELGISLYDDNDVDKAKDLLNKVITEENASTLSKSKAFCYLGIIELELKEYEQALVFLNQSVAVLESAANKDDSKALLGNRIFSRFLGRIFRILHHRFIPQFSSVDPNWKSSFKMTIAKRGETYRLMGRYAEAIADFDQVIKLDPKYRWAIVNRSETYLLMEDYPRAITDFNHLIQIDSEDKWAMLNYRLKGCYPEAIANFDYPILDPSDGWAIANRGETYRLMECYPEAIADFTRLIELEPSDGWAIASRGYTYHLMEHYPEAIIDFNRAIELDPEDDWVIAQRGETYTLTKNYEQALCDFNKALEIAPENDWGHYFRSLVYRTLEQVRKTKIDIAQAIQLAQRHYEIKPQDCQNILNLGIYHLVTGNLEQSQQLFQDALTKLSGTSYLKQAVRDLDDLLTILPHYPHLESMREYLKTELVLRQEVNDG